jgi:hypothetical protein
MMAAESKVTSAVDFEGKVGHSGIGGGSAESGGG